VANKLYTFKVWWYNKKADAITEIITVMASDEVNAYHEAIWAAHRKGVNKLNIAVRKR